MGDYDFDAAVVGGGSAGYAAVSRLAAEGLRAAIVEGGEKVGGLCILRGCMPTKALLYAAEVRHLTRQGPTWGLLPAAAPFNFEAVMRRKEEVVGAFADYRREQLETGRFTFLRDQARFTGPHSVALSQGQTLTARHFVVATGSLVATPPLADLDRAGYLNSDQALQLTRLPRSMIVLGGGAVAVEFAQFFARFDVKVTLVQRSPHVLHEMDHDLSSVLETVFRREGIDVFTDTRLTAAGQGGPQKWVSFFHRAADREVRIEAEEIFFALGRTPRTAEIGLEKAGVSLERGRILTNSRMQSTAPHIYAAGDCTGPHEIVHIAVQQGEVAAYNIAHPGTPRSLDQRLLALVIFTDPQIATVGLTEKEARKQGKAYLSASYPFADHGKSILMEAKDGFVKILADARTGEILGAGVIGPLGGELIHEIIAAMAKRMTVHELAEMPHYHPTLAEIWTYPAAELAVQIPTRSTAGEVGVRAALDRVLEPLPGKADHGAPANGP